MKKLLILAAAAALLLASCAKVETTTKNTMAENTPIVFSNYTPRSITKADGTLVNSTTLIEGKAFGVYAYALANNTTFETAMGGTTKPAPNFMSNQSVTYVAANNSTAKGLEYEPLRYWPSGTTPDKLTFWAYYPVAATGLTPTVTNGLGSFAFTVQKPASAQVDFLVSDVVPDLLYQNTTNGVVELDFHHMLTKVQFYFKTDKPDSDTNTEVKITSATLTNVKTTGTLTPVYPSAWANARWSGVAVEGTPKEFAVVASDLVLTETAKTPNGTVYNATYPDTGNIYLMIPQEMVAAGQTLTINYTVTSGTGNSATVTNNVATVELVNVKTGDPAATIDWAMNNVVTYTITVGLHPVKFQADVANWTSPEIAGAITVQ